jgi:hypothetical protein
LIVIASPEEVARVESLITAEAYQDLQEIDFESDFALLVNQGLRRMDGYAVNIQRVVRRGDEISVIANFQEPRPTEAASGVISFPYQLIRVHKSGEFGREFNFTLLASIVDQKSVFMP